MLPITGWRELLPLRVVEVSGPSMVPTLHHGDVVLARRAGRRRTVGGGSGGGGSGGGAGRVRPGSVVLARFRAVPDRLVVKRAVRPVDGGWWLASDNTFAGGDSAVHGVADVEAVVVLRVHGDGPRRLR